MLRRVVTDALVLMTNTTLKQVAPALGTQLPCSLGNTGWSARFNGTSAASAAGSSDEPAKLKAMQSKLLYRSKQRGFLELDLLVGLWAEREIPNMDMKMLTGLAEVLDQENPDLFKWLTGQEPSPEHMMANPAYVSLRQHVAEQLGQNSQEATRAKQGAEWVRGWDDGWKKKPAASDSKASA